MEILATNLPPPILKKQEFPAEIWLQKGGLKSDRISRDEKMSDPKDIVFYEVALSVEDSYLVTGNTKQFPKKPFVVTPAEMLQIINEMKSAKTGLLSEPTAKYGSK